MKTVLTVSFLAFVCLGCATAPPASADNTTAATSRMADTQLQDYDLRGLRGRIAGMPRGTERDYFSGMLAARSGRFSDAISELERALPHLRDAQPKRAAIALEALGTAHRAINQYGAAAPEYAELSARFAGQLDRFPADDAALARILSGTPTQTIAWHGPVRLKTSTSLIGTRVAELVVNGVRGGWVLDTGANQSVVTRTFAERLGVMPLPGEVPLGSGLTGLTSSIRVAVLPTMQIDGAVLTNVVLLVIDDEKLRFGFGPFSYQINAILGYPVMKALESITFTRDEFRAGKAAERNGPAVPMYMRGLTPAIECEVEGRPLLLTVDTGASGSDLSVRYYELFHQNLDSWKTRTVESAGAGGSIAQTEYFQHRVVMKVGATAVVLEDVSIAPVRRNAAIDILFGNLGMDFVDGFESFTLNFSAMTFSFGAARQPLQDPK